MAANTSRTSYLMPEAIDMWAHIRLSFLHLEQSVHEVNRNRSMKQRLERPAGAIQLPADIQASSFPFLGMKKDGMG